MILTLEDGVILTSETDSDDLVQYTDVDGDGVADGREVGSTGIGQSSDSNIEHQKAGLSWALATGSTRTTTRSAPGGRRRRRRADGLSVPDPLRWLDAVRRA